MKMTTCPGWLFIVPGRRWEQWLYAVCAARGQCTGQPCVNGAGEGKNKGKVAG